MKTKTFTAEDPVLPMNYPGFVFRTLRNDGYDAAALLAKTGLTEDRLNDPDYRFGFLSLRRFVLNAIEVTGDPHLGANLARRFEATLIGMPAYTAMNAACFKDALDVARRFAFLTFPNFEFAVLDRAGVCEPGAVAIRLRPRLPLGDIAYFGSISALIVCDSFFKAVLRRSTGALRGELMVAEPEGWASIAAQIGFPMSFGRQDNMLVVPAEVLHERLPGADPVNHARLLSLCEKLAAHAGYETTLPNLVLSFLEADQNFGAPLSAAAAALGYSERGLRRQLERSGTSYRKLTEQVLESRARALLLNSCQPITTIAQDLGYDTPSNFARSFKRWTGTTPKAFRECRDANGDAGRN